MQTRIRGIRGGGSGEEVNVKSDQAGGLHVVQSLPYGAILTALGYGYQGISTAAVAALVARPSTVSLVTLWNGEAGGGKSLIIERAFVHQLVSAAAQSFFGIWLCVHPVGMTAPGVDISAIKSTRGKSGYGGNAEFGVDETVVDDGWFPWGNSLEVEGTGMLPGSQQSAEIGGRIIIPPTAGISLHVVASSVNEDFTAGFHWYEVQLDLG